MLSYPIDEAEELLESKLKAAKTSLRNCEEDLDFLREQITVSTLERVMRRGCADKVGDRQWRSMLRECITGTLCKRGRKRRRKKSKKGRRTREGVMVRREGNNKGRINDERESEHDE